MVLRIFCTAVFVVFLANPIYASSRNIVQTVAGKVEIVQVKARNEAKNILGESKITLNGKSVKIIQGFDPEFYKVFNGENITVAIVRYGTGGNHCSALDYCVIGFNKNKTFNTLNNLSFCLADDFEFHDNKKMVEISWRKDVSNVTIINYANNRFAITNERQTKTLTVKEQDEIYYIYKEMCSYNPYITKDFYRYKLNPAGYLSDTYNQYADILEKGPFKSLCYERQSNNGQQLLGREELIEELGLH